MIANIKMYFYGAVAFAIALFIFIFKLRGSKIENLQEKLNVNKNKYSDALKVAKYESQNKAKAEEAKKNEENITVSDGSYSL